VQRSGRIQFLNMKFLPRMVVHSHNLSTWETEAGRLWIKGQPGLHSKFEASLGYITRSCLKQKNSHVCVWQEHLNSTILAKITNTMLLTRVFMLYLDLWTFPFIYL
jgi:hypothetical protein